MRAATRLTAAIGAIAAVAAIVCIRLLDLTLPGSAGATTGTRADGLADAERAPTGALAPAEQVGAEVAEADRLASHPLALLLFLGLWAVPGVVAAMVMWWTGHDLRLWLVLGVGFGPIAAICAFSSRTQLGTPATSTLRDGAPRSGPVDVLVDADGHDATDLAEPVLELTTSLGDHLGRLTLARAVPQRSHERPDRLCDEEVVAMLELEALVARLEPLEPQVVLVHGTDGALARLADGDEYTTIASARPWAHEGPVPVVELALGASETTN
ncbi:MAG: hypothetical protein S0880_02725 [Actinomycetota bacterium]|nr:hypothetical protein [Actinomycetota bacterium]